MSASLKGWNFNLRVKDSLGSTDNHIIGNFSQCQDIYKN